MYHTWLVVFFSYTEDAVLSDRIWSGRGYGVPGSSKNYSLKIKRHEVSAVRVESTAIYQRWKVGHKIDQEVEKTLYNTMDITNWCRKSNEKQIYWYFESFVKYSYHEYFQVPFNKHGDWRFGLEILSMCKTKFHKKVEVWKR